MTKRKAVRRVGNRRAWATRFLLVALSAFLFLKAVQLHGQLRAKQLEVAATEQAIQKQEAINEDLLSQTDPVAVDENLLKDAYENNYARPGDQIIVVQG